jgi:transposase
VEQWAEIRRMHFVLGLSIKAIARRTGRDRNTVRRALRAEVPPRYARAPAGSKLDPFKDEIHRLLAQDPRLPGQRVRELIAPLGYAGGKTIVDDYLREVRPLFAPPRTYQRTIYRRVRFASSISGSRGRRCRSGMARRAVAGWWSRRWGSRARARGR